MQKNINRRVKPARQKVEKSQEHVKFQALQQEVANLKAQQEVTKKEIKALNALIQFERRKTTRK